MRCPPLCHRWSFILAILTLVTSMSPHAPSSAGEVQIAAGTRTLPAAPLGEPNRWPRFRFQVSAVPIHTPDNLGDEDRAGMFASTAVPPLPYLLQDGYSRKRRPQSLPVVRIENEALRAVCYPTLGGRLASLFDKRTNRELLFDNPVLQFANLAIRNAWFSGGVEWNGPLYGHSLLTCSPVYAGLVQTPRGPILRLYEFDRSLETTWQVDLFLPAGDDRLWVHVKAINPNAHDVPFYWWTNIAVPLTPETRVLAPLDYALSHETSGNAKIAFPRFADFDGSYPARHPHAKSVFFRKPGNPLPWSAYVDGGGRGLSHVSTPTLFGRKFFTWGTGRGGKRWMDFLSEPGQGNYIEIQGGVTPTQLQTRPLAAGASIEWTECLSPMAIDAAKAHAADYATACNQAASVVHHRFPLSEVETIDRFLRAQADAPIGTVLHRGTGWGWLDEKRTGRRISPGLEFTCQPSDDERPWHELLTEGTFSKATVEQGTPASFVVSRGWVDALKKSAAAHGGTWLHSLHLGIAQLEAGQFSAARQLLEESSRARLSAMAHRSLALIAEHKGLIDRAATEYRQAWSLANGDANLAVEIAAFLLQHQSAAEFRTFVATLPSPAAQHERLQIMQAQLALAEGDYPRVRRLVDREFCTIREGELSLSELWFQSYFLEAEKRFGRALMDNERETIVKQNPPPEVIDFRMR